MVRGPSSSTRLQYRCAVAACETRLACRPYKPDDLTELEDHLHSSHRARSVRGRGTGVKIIGVLETKPKIVKEGYDTVLPGSDVNVPPTL